MERQRLDPNSLNRIIPPNFRAVISGEASYPNAILELRDNIRMPWAPDLISHLGLVTEQTLGQLPKYTMLIGSFDARRRALVGTEIGDSILDGSWSNWEDDDGETIRINSYAYVFGISDQPPEIAATVHDLLVVGTIMVDEFANYMTDLGVIPHEGIAKYVLKHHA